jgi:hypothetical protein
MREKAVILGSEFAGSSNKLVDDDHLWEEYGKATSFEEKARLVKQMKWFSEWRVLVKATARSACQEGSHVVMADIEGGPISQIKAQEMPSIRKQVIDDLDMMKSRSFRAGLPQPLSMDLSIEVQHFATYQELEKFVADNRCGLERMAANHRKPSLFTNAYNKAAQKISNLSNDRPAKIGISDAAEPVKLRKSSKVKPLCVKKMASGRFERRASLAKGFTMSDEQRAMGSEHYNQMTTNFKNQLRHIAQSEKYLLKPGSYLMQHWDHLMIAALIFTALVTPYEVSFVEAAGIDALFIANRLVDFFFVCDMAISFNLMFHDPNTGVLVKSSKRIRRRYLCGWFSIDLITILPFDAVEYLELPNTGEMAALRFLRVLRLFKLLRILRASRIFKSAQTRFGISTSAATVMQLMLTLTLLNHWLACTWGMAAILQSKNRMTWLSVWLDGQELTSHECSTAGSPYPNAAYRNSGKDGGGNCWHHSDVYAACLHWSMMTVTSIGYGVSSNM